MVDLERYGVFLRPDAKTCAAVTRITAQLRAQYGLVSAGAFPPHATLVGSLPLACPVDELADVVTAVLHKMTAFPVLNAGVRRLGAVLVYDIHQLPSGEPNPHLIQLAAAVDAAVRPLLAAISTEQLAADVHDMALWHGHVSLATHELFERADLLDEVEQYVLDLEEPYPQSWAAEIVALYRLRHHTWTGAWWRDMQYEHLRSWSLQPKQPGHPG